MDVYYLTIFLSLVVGLLGFYYSFFRHVNQFRKAGIIYSTPWPILGNMWSVILRQKALPDIVNEIYNLHPDAKYVGFMDTLTPVIVIRDLDLVKSITVKHFEHFPNHRSMLDEKQDKLFAKNLFSLRDEKWRDVRNLLTPAFTSSKMKSMFKLMSDCAKDFADFMAKLPDEKSSMDVKDAFTRYTNDVIATCAFGISIDSMRNPNNEFYLMGREATTFDGFKTFKLFFIRSFPSFSKWLRIGVLSQKTVKFFTNIIDDTIRTRDEKGIHRPDMIQLMMDTRGKRGEGKELTLEDMTCQAFIFFFGGFDTTATLMCFLAHELCVNPEVQKKLQAEIDAVMEECKGDITYDAVNNMEYLEAVINETLRVWPIAAVLDRVCSKNYELPPALPGKKPFLLEKDSNVWVPCYGFQRDPKYFDDPEKFMPERFLDNEKKLANHPAYIPFGIGPRMCIGNRFALLEVKVMFCHLLHRCDLIPSSKTQNPLKVSKTSFTLAAERGFWLQVKGRSNTSNKQMSNGVSH